MSSDIIKIDVNVIRDFFQSLNINTIPDVLVRKKKDLYDNFKCFHNNYYQENENKKYVKFIPKKKEQHNHNTYNNNHHNDHNSNFHKLHILPVNFTEETKIKKIFIGLLNKLTDQNKVIIYKKIQDLLLNNQNKEIMSILFETFWDFIKKSSSKNYEKVFDFFDKELTKNYINTYILDKKWIPDEDILKNNILSSNTGIYELYCKYVKWKKETTNINIVICSINPDKNLINVLLNDLFQFFETFEDKHKTHKHIVDFALEQIHIISKFVYNDDIIKKINGKNIKNYESSTRFIILNIIELKYNNK